MEALRILREELERFRIERDQFKLMAETLQLRYSSMKRTNYGGYGGSKSVVKMLNEQREQNIRLTTEVECLKQKVKDLQGDIGLLRNRSEKEGAQKKLPTNEEFFEWKDEKSSFITYLENLKQKNAQLSFDLKSLIDEKEEAITERDAYKCKAHRLNHELLAALKANEHHPRILDVDGLVLENKYLQERLKNCESELDLTTKISDKYKALLESKKRKGIMKLGGSTQTTAHDTVFSHKQSKLLICLYICCFAESIQDRFL